MVYFTSVCTGCVRSRELEVWKCNFNLKHQLSESSCASLLHLLLPIRKQNADICLPVLQPTVLLLVWRPILYVLNCFISLRKDERNKKKRGDLQLFLMMC